MFERTAYIICVGTELTEGITQDTHLRSISASLTSIGLSVLAGVVIPDDRAIFLDVLSRAVGEAGLIIITGGLGPTSDDLTREVAAEIAGVPLEFHPEVWESIRGRFPGSEPPPANRKQAMAPAGFSLIANLNGTAPGFYGEMQGALVIALPGPPRELVPMYRQGVESLLQERFGAPAGSEILWATAMLVPESVLEEALRTAQSRGGPETGTHMGSRGALCGCRPRDVQAPAQGTKGISWGTRLEEDRIAFSLRGGSEAGREQMLAGVIETLGSVRVRRGETRPAAILLDALKAGSELLVTAESCTGGLVGKMITDIPGSSAAYWGGFVTYSNEAKTSLLGVDTRTLEKFGAVSAEIVTQMAFQARRRSGAALGIAVSGIAGPDGGSVEKPVGTVWIGVSYAGKERAARFLFSGGRDMIRRRAAVAALLFGEAVMTGKSFP